MRRFSILIILLIIAAVQDSPAQKRKAERAYAAFNAGEYFDAIDEFKDAYSKTQKTDKASRTELVFMIAESYRLINDPKNSETWYKLAVKSPNSKPEAQYWLALSLKKNGKYPQAIDEFKKYKWLTDPITDKPLNHPEDANNHVIDPTGYAIEFYRRNIKPL